MRDFFMPSQPMPTSTLRTESIGTDAPSIVSSGAPPPVCHSEEQISPIQCQVTEQKEVLPVDVQVVQEKINRWLHDPNLSCSRDPYCDHTHPASKRTAFAPAVDDEVTRGEKEPATKKRRTSSPHSERKSGQSSIPQASAVAPSRPARSVGSDFTVGTSGKTTPRAQGDTADSISLKEFDGSSVKVMNHVLEGDSQDGTRFSTPKRQVATSYASLAVPFSKGSVF